MKQGYFIGASLVLTLGYLFSLILRFEVDNNSPTPVLQKTKDIHSKENFLRFHVIGDYGEMNPSKMYPIIPVQLVANAMSQQALKSPTSMVLTVGDNFYPKINSYFDPLIFSVLEEVFNQTGIHEIP